MSADNVDGGNVNVCSDLFDMLKSRVSFKIDVNIFVNTNGTLDYSTARSSARAVRGVGKQLRSSGV